jgi:hypothetical protein
MLPRFNTQRLQEMIDDYIDLNGRFPGNLSGEQVAHVRDSLTSAQSIRPNVGENFAQLRGFQAKQITGRTEIA